MVGVSSVSTHLKLKIATHMVCITVWLRFDRIHQKGSHDEVVLAKGHVDLCRKYLLDVQN